MAFGQYKEFMMRDGKEKLTAAGQFLLRLSVFLSHLTALRVLYGWHAFRTILNNM
jgi:hypothetical protein